MNQDQSSNNKKLAHYRDRKSSWEWSLLCMTVLMVCGGAGVYAVRFLATVPPPPNCKEISTISADGERLYCAHKAASTGSLDQLWGALELVESWSSSHPLYAEAQRLMGQWSQAILVQARQQMHMGNMSSAVATLSKISATSPVYEEAKAYISDWQVIWDRGEKIEKAILKEIEGKKWQSALNKLQLFSNLDNPYWKRKRFGELRQMIASEKQAWKDLAEARRKAKIGRPEEIEAAINLARGIGIKSYARPEAQAEMARWSRSLIDMARKKLPQGSWAEAIAIAGRVPQDTALYREAQDMILLSRAQGLAAKENISSWLEAKTIAGKIGPDSPLYSQAQGKMESWEQHIQDRLQIKFANVIANVGQPVTFSMASEVAQMVEKDRPRRIQAQTQIAHWRKEIQRIEDRPLIMRARQLAQTETIEGFRAAVTEASLVKLGRPQRREAQTLIAEWNKRIEVMEDKAIIARASSLADQGNLQEAIEVAKKIAPGRVLYSEAQEAIEGWDKEIQIAEDRETLEDGYYLASIGRYTAAIQTASSIDWGRPIYYEAQDAIASWRSELAVLYAPPPEPQLPTTSDELASSDEPDPAYEPAPAYRLAPRSAQATPPGTSYQAPVRTPAYSRQPVRSQIPEPELNY